MMRKKRKTTPKDVVFRLLNIRLRSEHELREKLKVKNYDQETIDQTIQYFKDLDLINDRLFTQCWISSRLKKPFGLTRIQRELFLKGINKTIIKDEFSKIKDEFDEVGVVCELALRRAEKYKGLEPIKIRQRVYGYLVRRGFSQPSIIKAIQKL